MKDYVTSLEERIEQLVNENAQYERFIQAMLKNEIILVRKSKKGVFTLVPNTSTTYSRFNTEFNVHNLYLNKQYLELLGKFTYEIRGGEKKKGKEKPDDEEA